MEKGECRMYKGMGGGVKGWMDGCDRGVEAVFVSLPVRHSKSEADKVIL